MCSNSEIDDDYEHLDDTLEYVLENVLSAEDSEQNVEEFECLSELYNSVLLDRCKCTESSNCSDCFHGGNYVKNAIEDRTELVLSRNNQSDVILECSALCSCSSAKCNNRLVQYGPRKHLKIMDSQLYKSKGLATTQAIPCGAFICEYAGELLTRSQARRRVLGNERNDKMNYVLCLNELEKGAECRLPQSLITIIDPSRKGNIGRYLNHSCEPNCEIRSVRVDCPVPKIAIFAKRVINAGEELCFHYNGSNQLPSKIDGSSDTRRQLSKQCLCQSKVCQKFLPNMEFL